MKVSKSAKILAAVMLLAAAGAGGWLYLTEESDGGGAPAQAAAKKSPAKSPTSAAKAGATPVPSDPDEVIKAIIEASGVQQLLLDVRQQALKNADAGAKGQQGAPDIKGMQIAIERSFDPEKIAADLAVHLKQSYDADRMPRFLELLRQPVAAKMSALEAQQPAQQAIQQYFDALKKSPPSLARQQLIQRADEATRASEAAAELAVMMIKNMVQAAQAANPQVTARTSRQDLERSMVPLRGDLSAHYRNMHHFVYRQASDAELGEYVKLLGSDIGKWGTSALNDGIRAVVEARGRELGIAVAQLAPVKVAAQATEAAPPKPLGDARVAPASEGKAESDGHKTGADDKGGEGGEMSAPRAAKPKPPAPSAAHEPPAPVLASTIQAESKHATAERPAPRRVAARPLFARHNDLLTATIMMDHASMAELLTFGKSPNVRQGNGITPLMIAASYGDVEGVRLLVAKGAELNQRLSGGETALTLARSRGKAEVAALLESYGARP